jgi:hypothetical protein
VELNLRLFNVVYLISAERIVLGICRRGRGGIAMVVLGNYRTRAELRRKPRRQFHYSARILMDKNGPPRECSIADISETGARLLLAGDEEVPDRFVLLLTATGDARRVCRVVWRTGLTVGVEFPDSRS